MDKKELRIAALLPPVSILLLVLGRIDEAKGLAESFRDVVGFLGWGWLVVLLLWAWWAWWAIEPWWKALPERRAAKQEAERSVQRYRSKLNRWAHFGEASYVIPAKRRFDRFLARCGPLRKMARDAGHMEGSDAERLQRILAARQAFTEFRDELVTYMKEILDPQSTLVASYWPRELLENFDNEPDEWGRREIAIARTQSRLKAILRLLMPYHMNEDLVGF